MGHLLHDTKETYLQLQRRVDNTQAGLPSTEQLHDILQHLFTPEEARIAALMPVVPRSLGTIAQRVRMRPDELRPLLDRMADKGLVFDFHHPSRGAYFMLAPPVIGFFEFSMMRVRSDIDQKQVAHLLSTYLYDRPEFARALAQGGTPIGRTLVREDTLEPADQVSTEVLDYERATQIARQASAGAVSLCYCRHKRQHLGEACDNPLEVCLSLGNGADFVVRHGYGRPVDVSERLEILERCRSLGLVQIADNVQQKPTYICNCCACCCGQLAAINRHGLQHAVATSSFIASIRRDQCHGCGKCSRACPVQAISLHPVPQHQRQTRGPKMFARIDEQVCLGCGVCKPSCTNSALTMKRRAQRTLTPANTLERVLRTHLGRGTLHGVLFDELDGPSSAFANRLIGAIERMPVTRRAMLNETLKSRFVQFLCKAAVKDRRQPAEVYEG